MVYAIVGLIITIIVRSFFRWLMIKENRKGCKYDPETKCWHKVF